MTIFLFSCFFVFLINAKQFVWKTKTPRRKAQEFSIEVPPIINKIIIAKFYKIVNSELAFCGDCG